jgi:hypothetical protein
VTVLGMAFGGWGDTSPSELRSQSATLCYHGPAMAAGGAGRSCPFQLGDKQTATQRARNRDRPEKTDTGHYALNYTAGVGTGYRVDRQNGQRWRAHARRPVTITCRGSLQPPACG